MTVRRNLRTLFSYTSTVPPNRFISTENYITMRHQAGPGACLVFFAVCALAFTSIALNANWWTARFQLLSSTIPALTAGQQSEARFHLLKVVYTNDFNTTNASGTKSYSDIPGLDRDNFNSIRGITIALIATSCVLVLYGFSASKDPVRAARASPLFGFLSFACFVLALTNLCLLADVPNSVGSSFINSFTGASSGSYPSFLCGQGIFTVGQFTFSGATISCGNVWKTWQFSVSSGTSSAQAKYQTFGGAVQVGGGLLER